VLSAYNDRKQEETVHPFLKDRVPLGLLPHLQARLLARRLRGDLPDYVPFLMR
jgi:CRISPR-associated protein Cas1